MNYFKLLMCGISVCTGTSLSLRALPIKNKTFFPLTFRLMAEGVATIDFTIEANSHRDTLEVTPSRKFKDITVLFPDTSTASISPNHPCIIVSRTTRIDPGIFFYYAEYYKDKECIILDHSEQIGDPQGNPPIPQSTYQPRKQNYFSYQPDTLVK